MYLAREWKLFWDQGRLAGGIMQGTEHGRLTGHGRGGGQIMAGLRSKVHKNYIFTVIIGNNRNKM